MKILITTSGLGSRLGNLTKFTNKSLAPFQSRAMLSHVINCYPKDSEFIITIGHFGDLVKQFVSLVHPLLNVKFVEIDKYQGPESSLLYSISKAKEYLQAPFIFHACDTFTNHKFSPEDLAANFICTAELGSSEKYRSVRVSNNKITEFLEKGENNYDYIYVGIAGIFDFINFWAKCDELLIEKKDYSDVHVLKSLNNINNIVLNDWIDTGNIEDYKKNDKNTHNVLQKDNEAIYFYDDFVVKFFSSKEDCESKVKQTSYLGGYIPKILGFTDNFFSYEFVSGQNLEECIDHEILGKLFLFCKDFWVEKEDINGKFNEECVNFYVKKTKERVAAAQKILKIEDTENIINGLEVPKLSFLLDYVFNNELHFNQKPSRFHGDFILSNIIYDKSNDIFKMIDNRGSFGGNTNYGDFYYDAAKFNHSLTLNHSILSKKDSFKIDIRDKTVNIDLLISGKSARLKEDFHSFLIKNNYDLRLVKILTCLVWASMSPLHEYPLNNFLYFWARYNLFLELKNKL